MKPLVSIVTPTYNSRSFLGDAIRSVQSQTFADWEMFIVDDCSSDDSHQTACEFAEEDPRIRPIRLQENSGAAVARNVAIRSSRGRYIAFLDSDDVWLPEKLSMQLRFMECKRAAFSYTGFYRMTEAGESLGTVSVPESMSYRQLLRACVIGCLTAMYDSEVLGKVEMPLIRKRQDYGLWLRLLRMTPVAHGLDQPLAAYRVRSNSISANKWVAARYTWRLYRDVEKLPILSSLYFLSSHSIRTALRTRAGHFQRKP